MSDAIIVRHRPETFDAVHGHDTEVETLKRRVKTQGASHGYLFVGPSGTGKTTLARIIAKEIGAEVLEQDASFYNSVENMRNLIDVSGHRALSGAGRRMVILNEVQGLSKAAWNSLLTTLEEPPAHLYFALTTTESQKIPPAARTRCYEVVLNKLSSRALEDVLSDVIAAEKWDVADDVFNMVLRNADGSARLALSLLDKVHDLDPEEAERVISQEEGGGDVIELCKYLLNGEPDWHVLQKMLAKIDDENFERIQVLVVRFMMGAMAKSKDEKRARNAWMLIDCFLKPLTTWDQKAAFYRAIGLICWG